MDITTFNAQATANIYDFPAVQAPVEQEDFAAIDPYQEYFDYLVDQGTQTGDAWDQVWENPRRSAQIGMKLAAYRIEPGMALTLAS